MAAVRLLFESPVLKPAVPECRRVSGAGRRTKLGQVRPAMGWVIAMGISVFGGVAPCAVPRGMAALALLLVPF